MNPVVVMTTLGMPSFSASMAGLTEADVAASPNLTGAGGDETRYLQRGGLTGVLARIYDRVLRFALARLGAVLVPINFTLIEGPDHALKVTVRAIMGRHFADIPGTRNPEIVTKLEEEKIFGYFGAGTLYADPAREESLV